MKKEDEKFKRTRYTRGLEKFTRQIKSALKREDFDPVLFNERVSKNAKNIEKIESVKLNSSYMKELEDFVSACLSLKFSQSELLNKLNSLEKLKNSQSYKKEKHKTRSIDDQCDF